MGRLNPEMIEANRVLIARRPEMAGIPNLYRLHESRPFESLGLPTFDDIDPLTPENLSHGLHDFYNGVIAFAIKRTAQDGKKEILVGRRSPEANDTHADLISVPTFVAGMDAVADSLKEDHVNLKPRADSMDFEGVHRSFGRGRDATRTRLGQMATILLSSKMNLGNDAEKLVLGSTLYYQNLILGGSIIDSDPATGVDTVEAVAMLSIAIEIPPHLHELSEQLDWGTGALDNIRWPSLATLVKAHRGPGSEAVRAIYGDAGSDEESINRFTWCSNRKGNCVEAVVRAVEAQRNLGLPDFGVGLGPEAAR